MRHCGGEQPFRGQAVGLAQLAAYGKMHAHVGALPPHGLRKTFPSVDVYDHALCIKDKMKTGLTALKPEKPVLAGGKRGE